ncbi:hypothetical protein DNU06_11010 [Putridiphycobacter roseus]|uniref:Carboxypeptidase-like regulatory domain-containing protein n=1 Tax=Putridiphycobacter roseus TaxID=2219161 RepID=A0A2W1NMB6_9FLAO|nr:DUF5686 family protein [Putridiphycobacter roseus]PZE16782.1 hypothetical protein DNU06_11010 [Putridiphycobacter roseus]
MKLFFTLLILIISNSLLSQYVLKGNVTDDQNMPIPGVRVFIDQTTYGVITDLKGGYFIELSSKKNYPIAFKMLGMKDTVIPIDIHQKITTFDIQMLTYSERLETVEVSSKKIDVAKQVIKAMQDNRNNMANQYENYTCNTYLKTSLEKSIKPNIAERSKEIDSIIAIGPAKMNFIESFSITKFKTPNTYKEEIVAQHDYADKSSNNFSASINFNFGTSIVPIQYIATNPYIFFEKIQDGDFNLYQNMLNLPKISEHPIVSPIGFNAFLNYNFDLANIFYEQETGHKIYEIKVIPKFKQAALFEGTLFIIDKLWVIQSFELNINSAAMPFFKDFTVLQDYQMIDSAWVPIRREYVYAIQDGKYIISANTRVNHSNYTFNNAEKKKDFDNEILVYQSEAFTKDSAYWDGIRPIQLKATELSFIHEQDSIEKHIKSEAYLDSLDKAFNKITFWDVTLNGVAFRDRFKEESIYIKPLFSSIRVFGVGGFRLGTGGIYTKKFKNAQKIKVDADLDYGFNNKDLKWKMGLEYTFLPKRFGLIELRGGDSYDLITDYNSVLGTFSRGNYVRKQFIEIGHRIEIVNGLYGKINLSYSDRQGIDNLILSEWSALLFGELNQPATFDRYIISLVEFQFLYRFKQKYIIKKNEKQLIGTKYPELELTYRKGIPKLFNSEVNFDFIELKASDEINLGNYGDSKWSVLAGTFVNEVDLRFMEHKFFRGSDRFFFSNPLRSHQLLDSTFNTSKPYFQTFYVHHFNGFIMNKIPLINKLKLELTAGASALIIQDIAYSHAELFAGLEKKFRIKKQYFKVGVFMATRANSSEAITYQFKIGMDFFNSFTNTWTY